MLDYDALQAKLISEWYAFAVSFGITGKYVIELFDFALVCGPCVVLKVSK